MGKNRHALRSNTVVKSIAELIKCDKTCNNTFYDFNGSTDVDTVHKMIHMLFITLIH